MNIRVEKLDDINIIISGTVDHNVLKKKISELRAKSDKVLKDDNTLDDDTFQREAEGQMLQDFIDQGMKEAKVTPD